MHHQVRDGAATVFLLCNVSMVSTGQSHTVTKFHMHFAVSLFTIQPSILSSPSCPRKQTGVGYPQLSAILECADAAHGLGGHVISDGGCTCPGDFSKAFGGGADFVMAGGENALSASAMLCTFTHWHVSLTFPTSPSTGMFASHAESGGELVEIEGKLYKQFYGMSSAVAMNKHAGKFLLR